MISWNKQAADNMKCELSQLNPTAQVKTAFDKKVIFSVVYPVICYQTFVGEIVGAMWRLENQGEESYLEGRTRRRHLCQVKYNLCQPELI